MSHIINCEGTCHPISSALDSPDMSVNFVKVFRLAAAREILKRVSCHKARLVVVG